MRATCLPRVALVVATVFLVAPTPAEAVDPPVPESARVVYSNDFENTVGREWSLPITDTTPTGRHRFLGQFGNDSVGLTLRNLPARQG